MLGDVTTRKWIRDYIIKLMGHTHSKKKLAAMDFSKALYEHLELPWGGHPSEQAIRPTVIYAALHHAGAQYMEIKQGTPFHDHHGAADVVNRQRPQFLIMYNMGANWLKMRA